MKRTHFFYLFVASVIMMSCGTSDPREKETDYDAMAKELCVCLRPMFDFQQEIIQLVMEGKLDQVENMREKALELETKGEACVKELEAKYGIIEGEEKEAKATEALRKACPDIVSLMEGGMPDPSMLEDIPLDELEKELEEMMPENGEEQ